MPEFKIAEDPPAHDGHDASLPPRNAIPPFAALRAFDAVARLGGVRKAAEMLSLDHAVVSRHLRAIEAWTGTTLIERTRTGVLLTEDGLRYHKRIAVAIDTIASATIDLMKRSDNNRLHTWAMPGFAFHWLMGRLSVFEASNPGLDIELRPTDMCPDFARHEADVDIRFANAYGPPLSLPPGVRSVEIARMPTVPLASPDYVARSPDIERPEDLLGHALLHEESYDGWSAWLSDHGVTNQEALSGPRLWHGHLTLDAARRGRGIALGNHLIAADDIAAGRLVEVGAGLFEHIPLGAYLFVARADRWNAPQIARFRHWLLAAVAAEVPTALATKCLVTAGHR
ncbi:LysR substrate-binding domain-containing protein [Parvibaculum sp.]|uniref:LysR substrate-binding domain-containing protein n=1 Tax=Parvibaculum sp. TaxID=2024848 RepID=UPI002B8F30BF|nr:LysR substrate-binding domain-containing protein [Parvibaculum sp.]HUD50876.1 LysR substrate-binding domain-containing protein [Parvibaculum sp.]